MAKLDYALDGDFDCLLQRIETGILEGSISASLEAQSDFEENGESDELLSSSFSYTAANSTTNAIDSTFE